VLAHVEAPDPDSRFWATYLLTELVYADAIDAAVARAFDEDAKVRRAARAAVHALAEAHPTPVVERLGEFTLAQTVELRVRAIEALAETCEPSAVPVLLPLLEENEAEIAVATGKALMVLARQDFGLDSDKWREWWRQNKGRHRIEWLIDSLGHEHRKMRLQAGEELKWITKETFGYFDDLPRRERERAQKRFRDWWENIGRVRFSRAATRGA
jgi:HEAT repeat protein